MNEVSIHVPYISGIKIKLNIDETQKRRGKAKSVELLFKCAILIIPPKCLKTSEPEDE